MTSTFNDVNFSATDLKGVFARQDLAEKAAQWLRDHPDPELRVAA